jgi:hypothetical protein
MNDKCGEHIENLINKYIKFGWSNLTQIFTNNKIAKEKVLQLNKSIKYFTEKLKAGAIGITVSAFIFLSNNNCRKGIIMVSDTSENNTESKLAPILNDTSKEYRFR